MSNSTISTLTNSTEDDDSQLSSLPVYVLVTTYAFLSLCIVIGSVGNLCIVVTIVRLPTNNRPAYYLIASIAASHSMVCVFVMPFRMASLLVRDNVLGQTLCHYSAYSAATTMTTTNLLLCVTALQRYLGTMHPSCYEKVKSNVYTLGMVIISWVLPLFILFIVILAKLDDLPIYKPRDLNCKIRSESHLNIFLSLLYLPSALVMLCSYLLLFYKIKKMSTTVAPVQDNTETSSPTIMSTYIMKHQFRLTLSIFLILTAHFMTAMCPGIMWAIADNYEGDPRPLRISSFLLTKLTPVLDVIIILGGNKILWFRLKNLCSHIFGYGGSDPNSINWVV